MGPYLPANYAERLPGEESEPQWDDSPSSGNEVTGSLQEKTSAAEQLKENGQPYLE